MSSVTKHNNRKQRIVTKLFLRYWFPLMFAAAMIVLWLTNQFLTPKFTETLRTKAELRATVISGSISNLLQRHSLIPTLLARNTSLISDLQSKTYTATSQKLIEFKNEVNVENITLLDIEGRAIASSDRHSIGKMHRGQPYMTQALRISGTSFTVVGDVGAPKFYYSHKLSDVDRILGVIVVEVNLQQLESIWRNSNELIVLTDAHNGVLMSSYRNGTLKTLNEIFKPPNNQTAYGRAVENSKKLYIQPYDVSIDQQGYLITKQRLQFRGWQLYVLDQVSNIRERVYGIMAIELMLMAILTAAGFYLLSVRSTKQTHILRAESKNLRNLNQALSLEIETRKRMEQSLAVAEQSLEQSSKMAVLGEMSAAMTHELNQPLSAMKTYLAGAKLLLERNRHTEALSSFQRIDDLIDRMNSIIKQLKSYSRKGGEDLVRVDIRDAVTGALSIMAPQLSQNVIKIKQIIPDTPVYVLANSLRLEQIIINLLKNAIDEIFGTQDPIIEIIILEGDPIHLLITDNGPGIENPNVLFEPFFTTKQPGAGLGLGLAISSGIAKDLGGTLRARTGEDGGAIFELELPLYKEKEIT